jgi:glycosyltransferase involved in cell wall biosynthesis
MRIGVVTTSYPRHPDDWAGGFVAEHVQWLRAAGQEVEVIAAGPGDGAAHRVPAPAGLFYEGGAPEALAAARVGWIDALRFSAAMTAAVARRGRRWDATIAHWLTPCAFAAAATRRRRLLAIAHSGDVHLLLRTGLAVPAAAALAAAGTRVVFVSESLRDRFASALPGPLRRRFARAPVCAMGVDVPRLRAASGRAALGTNGGRDPYVLFLGRLVPIKGIETLAAAAPLWSDRATTVVAGDGPERARLPPGAHVGEVLGAARDRLLAGAAVVVLPSVAAEHGRTEGFPVVALEAMAAGAPLVATATGGLAELPADTVTHVPPGDPAALAGAVRALIDDPARRARQVAAAARFAAARDWSIVGPRLFAELTGP